MHFYAWKNGLKTGMYYLRSRPAVDAIKFTLNVEELLKATDGNDTESALKCLNAKIENEPEETKRETIQNGNSSTNGSEKLKSLKNYEEPEACINCSG
jgi:ribonucleotide reductase alpha subunit